VRNRHEISNTDTLIIKAIYLLLLMVVVTFGQQIADPNFDVTVTRPAYTRKHPKVLFDEAHFNFHTTTARYKPFADLITNDGYQVTPNKVKFEKKKLEGYDILKSAFTIDPSNYDQELGKLFGDAGQGILVFTRDKGLVADHPITRGRDEKERINRVMTFVGQSLKGAAGSISFLKLAPTALDVQRSGERNSAAGQTCLACWLPTKILS